MIRAIDAFWNKLSFIHMDSFIMVTLQSVIQGTFFAPFVSGCVFVALMTRLGHCTDGDGVWRGHRVNLPLVVRCEAQLPQLKRSGCWHHVSRRQHVADWTTPPRSAELESTKGNLMLGTLVTPCLSPHRQAHPCCGCGRRSWREGFQTGTAALRVSSGVLLIFPVTVRTPPLTWPLLTLC